MLTCLEFAPHTFTCLIACLTFVFAINALDIDKELRPKLSANASIDHPAVAVRWSDYDPLAPNSIVNIASEQDVLLTVQYCIANDITFLASGGGNGWSTTLNIGPADVIINLQGISAITFNGGKTEVTIQGGAIVRDVVSAAYDNGAQVVTGNCNCIGIFGANLGAGYSRLMGLYGFGVDNVLSMTVVNADGNFQTITPADTDLWWAYRGAGANFGIVTSATVKSYPVPTEQNGAWLGPLIFAPEKLEILVQAINDLVLAPEMAIFLYFAATPPGYTPSIIVFPFYLGTEAAGRAAFSSIFAVGPITEQTAWQPYNVVNAGSEAFCVRGGRKPSYSAAVNTLNPTIFRAIWNEYLSFLQNPGTEQTTVLVERYALEKAKSFGNESSSYPWRSAEYNVIVETWYDNSALDGAANVFGQSVRALLWLANGGTPPAR
ncbi:uncharacterized protein KY384_008765 [Bacidia gigantensis]|uniref:uncharacterized protein n=1 Tax=Bacidia gigantensis TaxID=2732470 RepID=UPI001D04D3BF|nr:uncharacterized protein KY384_008765 [Bacidia gigantensis]KAG8526564.1 hypothetical protein KY384_008765 [Bacidia gigantensis]